MSAEYGGLAEVQSRLLGSVAVPDLIVPAQWLDQHRGSARTGEQRLMLAILEQAIDDLQKPQNLERGDEPPETRAKRRRSLQVEARAWIMGDDAPFTFREVLEALDSPETPLDESTVRKRLLGANITLPRRSTNYGNVTITGTRERVR